MSDTEGGTWLVDLADAHTLEGVCTSVAAALGVPLVADRTNEQSVELLGHAFAGRHDCLVVLDNFEQVASLAAGTIQRWLELAPEARFVVTSRQKLNIPGEAVYELGPMGMPETLDDVRESEAVRLFVQRANAVQPGFVINTENRQALHDIVWALDGIPLAIELAAARMNVFTPAQLVERLQDRFKLLRGTTGDPRQLSMRATIDWSWNLLSPAEQHVLTQCAVFRGGFSMEAAEAVVELDDDEWTVDLVQALREKSLLQSRNPTHFPNEPRFSLFESVREYADEKLHASGSAERSIRAHRDYYLKRCTEWADGVNTHGGIERRRRLGLEIENLVAVWRAIADQPTCTPADADDAMQAVLALTPIFSIR